MKLQSKTHYSEQKLVKAHCDTLFQHVFTALFNVFKEVTPVAPTNIITSKMQCHTEKAC